MPKEIIPYTKGIITQEKRDKLKAMMIKDGYSAKFAEKWLLDKYYTKGGVKNRKRRKSCEYKRSNRKC